ncbi:MAG TPA: efflux RND transporter periplasmic adaptor subunit [Anaeromyxobacteraceae bacterium]|jgi:Cu(I)/Ag(I) efflux system membrane fusion protein|nr:efflux RND transporter periplasmic adaptor subunit [Anaeromyxobacteraceae bacterium]
MIDQNPSPARRFGKAALALTLIAGVALGVGSATLLGRKPAHEHAHAGGPAAEPAKVKYQCPMHPTIVQDHPGECPICGMQLVAMAGAGAPGPGAAAKAGERKVKLYRSPMDPKQTSPTPRKDEMGMDYLPVYEDELAGEAGSKVEGLATVNIDPSRQQLIGLATAPASLGPVGASWRTVGRVAVDETHVRHINVKVNAFVEHIYVDFIGKPVRKGDPLFSIYSPELLSLQSEYLLARDTQKALAGSQLTGASGDDLVAAARRRLELWDIPSSEIRELERTGKPKKALTLYSPISGVVTQKSVVHGMRLNAGDMPYEITDLTEVWVLADAYESDLSRIRVGTSASLSLQAFPNRAFHGKVAFVDPILDPKTRTAKVRLSFPNPRGELKPEMFGEVTLETAPRQGLHVPADAVIDSGTQKVVFVSLGEGKFQPRAVEVGQASGDQIEVLKGLAAGDQVVTRANFLVDSESRLRASLAAMGGK